MNEDVKPVASRKVTVVHFTASFPFSIRSGGSGGAMRVDFTSADTFYTCELAGQFLELRIKPVYAKASILGVRPHAFLVPVSNCTLIGFTDE